MRRTLVFPLLLALAFPLAAQPRAPARPTNLTETAVRLATEGVHQRNARTVLAAAEILRMVERGSPRLERLGSADSPAGPWDGTLSSRALFRLAQRLAEAQGDRMISEYIGWMLQVPDSVPVTRGAAGGPVYAEAYLKRDKEVSYRIEFDGGQTPNLLHVTANPGAVLRCTLHAASDPDRVAATDRSRAGSCSLRWHQATAGKMTLRIRNAGPATYLMVSSN